MTPSLSLSLSPCLSFSPQPSSSIDPFFFLSHSLSMLPLHSPTFPLLSIPPPDLVSLDHTLPLSLYPPTSFHPLVPSISLSPPIVVSLVKTFTNTHNLSILPLLPCHYLLASPPLLSLAHHLTICHSLLVSVIHAHLLPTHTFSLSFIHALIIYIFKNNEDLYHNTKK